MFNIAIYGFIFEAVGVVVVSLISVLIFFKGFLDSAMTPSGILSLNLSQLVLILAAFSIFSLMVAFFYKELFETITKKSGEKMFNTAGTLMLVGAILTIVIVGLYLMLIAWIIAAVAFFSVKTTAQITASSQ